MLHWGQVFHGSVQLQIVLHVETFLAYSVLLSKIDYKLDEQPLPWFFSAGLMIVVATLMTALQCYPLFACMEAPIRLIGYLLGSLYSDIQYAMNLIIDVVQYNLLATLLPPSLPPSLPPFLLSPGLVYPIDTCKNVIFHALCSNSPQYHQICSN